MKLEAESPAALVLRDARAPPRGRLTLLRIANLVQLKGFTRSAMSATGTTRIRWLWYSSPWTTATSRWSARWNSIRATCVLYKGEIGPFRGLFRQVIWSR